VIVAVAAAAGIGLPLAIVASTPGRTAAPTAPSRLHLARPTTTTTTTTVPQTTTTTTTDPGTLPQTATFPSAETPQFQAEMAALWEGVVTGSLSAALPAFFPESAYVQLKTIADPASDYENRLVLDFGADLAAAHTLLGAGAPSATLLAVNVPSQYGHWIPPGVCYNSVGYFEVANSRVVYQENGQTRSFGIASMISWRGVWYVVHLGAILRSSDQGIVEDPEIGPGTSADSTTC
jgi:hypothetical protein